MSCHPADKAGTSSGLTHQSARDCTDWRRRAVMHAQAVVSMLVAKGVEPGTFGEQWLGEAQATCQLDAVTEPFFAGALPPTQPEERPDA